MDARRIKQRRLSSLLKKCATGSASACPARKLPKVVIGSRRGISLTEILVVMVIMGIIVGISLAAFTGAFTRGREANTRALINKVDRALNDHLNQWISRTQPGGPNAQVLASDLQLSEVVSGTPATTDLERAQVIALKRLYKEEFPQLFIVPLDAGGNLIPDGPSHPALAGDWDPLDVNLTRMIELAPSVDQQAEELSGAAREYRKIILDIHRQELAEGRRGLANHDPATASAECLYMILLRAARSGSTESDPENFPHSEIEDTDRDGLPELVDGWGNPLRFYRSPIFFDSPGVQKGTAIYALQETREEDQYDPNRTLMLNAAPNTWWTNRGVAFETVVSYRTFATTPPFDQAPLAFHMLTDPTGGGNTSWNWDGATAAPVPTYAPAARAYKAQPLIVSAGPDDLFGIYPPPDWMSNAMFLATGAERQLVAGAPKITQRFLTISGGIVPPGAQEDVLLEFDKHLDNITNHELRAN